MNPDPVPTDLLIARIGDHRFAVDATKVTAVRGIPQTTKTPHAPAHLLGVFHHEGRILPLVDLPSLARTPLPERPRVVILETHENALGLVVDDVADVLPAPGARLTETHDQVPEAFTGFVRGHLVHSGDDPGSTQGPNSGSNGHDDRPENSRHLQSLLEEAPQWMRRIHERDDAGRHAQDVERAEAVLRDHRVHLIDPDRLWQTIGHSTRMSTAGGPP